MVVAVLAGVVAVLAGVLHVAIFVMESVLWRRPAVWRRFAVADQANADAVAPMAYNQGFYNLFLAVGAILGAVLWAAGNGTVGITLVIASLASMLGAALVLTTTGRRYLRPAAIQGTLPALGLVLAIVAAVA